jgi:guanyl-specific ribonuclease Sa
MQRRRLVDLLILALAVVFISTSRDNGLRHQGDVGEIAGIAGNEARKGRHMGFDTYTYPGDEVMRAWRHADVPYEWVGYYLPSAPCHKGSSWGGKRETLAALGWGVAVVYVGQQPWGDVSVPAAAAAAIKAPKPKPKAKTTAKSPPSRKAATTTKQAARRVPAAKAVSTRTAPAKKPSARKASTTPTTCSRAFVTAVRGTLEADDAIAKTAAEGFPPGTVVFLNIERMNRVPQEMRDYYRAWTARMLADGRYRPGFYAHKFNAQIVYDDVKAEYELAGRRSEPPFWIAGGRGFSPEREPHEVGHAFAKVWQGVLDVVEEWKGFKLPLDVNVARVPSPSSHLQAD